MRTEWATMPGPSGNLAILSLHFESPFVIRAKSGHAAQLAKLVTAALDGAASAGPDFVLILRAQSDGKPRFEIDPEATEGEAQKIALDYIREQVPLYRALLGRRALALLVVGLSQRDALLLRSASEHVGAELRHEGGFGPGSDAWLVSRFALHTATDAHGGLDNVLSSLGSVLARRGERARRATGELQVPAGLFGPSSRPPKTQR
jgi:hypothetical protein